MAIHAHDPELSLAPHLLVMANLRRAGEALSHDPDLASLYLDGALRDALALALGDAASASSNLEAALRELDARQPLLAQRLRLALRAPHVEARLAHARALLDLLNPVPARRRAHP